MKVADLLSYIGGFVQVKEITNNFLMDFYLLKNNQKLFFII